MHIGKYFLKVTKKYPKICLFISLFIVCYISLKVYYSLTPLPAKKWIDSNLENIHVKDPTDFSFALFGGGKAGRIVFKGLLEQVDHDPDIAFAVDLGDAVLKGRKPHYHHFIKQLDNNLGIPLLTVMGDNELSGEGRDLYSKIFGPFNYSFRIGKNYFIVIDNAGEEGPDNKQIIWLENELKISGDYETRIIFMHRPLYDPGEYNYSKSMSEETSFKLINLFLKYHVTHIFASQPYGYNKGDYKGIPYTLTGGTGRGSHKRHMKYDFFHFLKVNVENYTIDVEFKKEFSSGDYQRKHAKYDIFVFLDRMIRIYWLELSLITFILLASLFFMFRKKRL